MCAQYVHVHGCVHVHIYTLTLYTCTYIHVYVKPTCTCTCVFIHKVQYMHMYLDHVEGNEACMVYTMYVNVSMYVNESSTCILKGTCTRHLVKHINFDIVAGTYNLVVVCHSAPCLSEAR